MTSSNNGSRKVRTRTFVSVVLFALILGGFSYLYLRISEQSLIYGDVKTNLDRYTAALEEKELEFEKISGLLSKKVSELAVTNRAWLEESSELQRVQADLEAARGELEITALLEAYLRDGDLHVEKMGRGYTWLDTGTHASLLDASNFVRTLTERQGLQVGSPSEVAYQSKWITKEQIASASEKF